MRDTSSLFRQEAYAQQMGNVPIHLLDVTYTDNNGQVQNFYFCDQYVPITSNGTTYQPAAFQITLGEDSSDSMPTVNLQFDSGDRQLIRELRENNKAPRIQVRVVLSSTPNTAEIGPIEFTVSQFTAKSSSIDMTLDVEPILNEPIPSAKFTPTLFPGLWKTIA